MKCQDVREQMMECGAELEASAPEVQHHVAGCAACSEQWAGLRKTLALLDEWKAPEPSPYFSTRLGARLRQEQEAPVGWLERMRAALASGMLMGRRAALATAMAALVASGVVLMRNGQLATDHPHENEPVTATVGTPVGDLETLDKNFDLYANFDLLDDAGQSAGQSSVPSGGVSE